MKYSQIVAILIILFASLSMYNQSLDLEKADMQETETLLDVYSVRLANIIDGTIKVTEILKELIVLHNGNPPLEDVERLSSVLFDDEVHINLGYAPDGVVEFTYPYAGNERAIGHRLLEDPITRYDSLRAMETKQATLSKPYELRQGGAAAVVRDPVFVEQDGEEVFWGFVAVSMKTSKGLSIHSDIDTLEKLDYGYHLSYCYDNEKIDILQSSDFSAQRPNIVNSFSTKYGIWELTLYHEPSIPEVIIRITALSFLVLSLLYGLFLAIYYIKKSIKK